jgi:hypothetical protein
VFWKYEPLSDGFGTLKDIQINMGTTALKIFWKTLSQTFLGKADFEMCL